MVCLRAFGLTAAAHGMGKRVVTQVMVESCAELFTAAELAAYKQAAAKALLEDKPRVVMTGSNMRDSSYNGTFIEGDPEFILALVKRAIAWQEREEGADSSIANRSMSHADFSRRPVGW